MAFDRLFNKQCLCLYFKWMLTHLFYMSAFCTMPYFDSCQYCFTAWPRYKLLKIRKGRFPALIWWNRQNVSILRQEKLHSSKKQLGRIYRYMLNNFTYMNMTANINFVVISLRLRVWGGGDVSSTPYSIILSRQLWSTPSKFIMIWITYDDYDFLWSLW